MAIEWSNQFSVNIKEIDDQHKKLFETLNELESAMLNNQGNSTVGKVLDFMLEYAHTHFDLEEKLMEQNGYPDLAQHMAEHSSFVKKVGEFKSKHDRKTSLLGLDVMNFLFEWLITHISKTDIKYAPFLNGKGIK
jgi:hemerythrin